MSAIPAAEADFQQVHTLYSDHHGWLQSWLRRKLGNSFDAADLAQDTFARLLSARNPEVIAQPRAYLTSVAKNILVNWYQRQALERAYLEAIAHLPEATSPSPEERLLVLEALAAVSRVLDGLKPRTREVFLLSQLDGLPYAEIAQRLCLSIHVVQKDMVKAYAHCYDAVYDG